MGTVVIAGATAVCGLLLVRGVSPGSPTADVLPFAAPGPDDPGPTTTATTAPTTITTTTITTTTIATTTSSTTTTMPPSTTSTSTTAPPSTSAPTPSVVPLSVDVSSLSVGVGGQVLFSGTCDTVGGQPAGPVVVDVVGDVTQRIPTGIVADRWAYEWQAPTDPALIRSYTFQFWCGDPADAATGYPLSLQHTVDMVASAPADPAPAPAADPAPVIPATG